MIEPLPGGEDRLRCVFLGPGRWGRVLLPHVASQFDVAAVVGSGSSGSRAWLEDHLPDTLITTDISSALSQPGVEAVFVATPTDTHSRLAVLALETGCHVFVEKPLALRRDEAAATMRRALERELELFIGYVYLFHPGLEVLQAVAPPEKIRSIDFQWSRPGLGAPPVVELLCHELAILVALTGELPNAMDVLRVDDSTFVARMEMRSGPTVDFDLRSPTGGRMKRKLVTVTSDDGAVHVWRDDQVETTGCRGSMVVSCGSGIAVTRELNAFRNAISLPDLRMSSDLRYSVGIAHLLEVASAGLE